jgi:TP53 regulating kinase-like protein
VYTPTVLHVDLEHSSLYLARVDGQSVKEALHANSLPTDEIHRVMKEIGKAVAKLHDGGIIHGDLTTSNIMLRPDGRVVRAPVCPPSVRHSALA